MKILHTADWHAGRTLRGKDRNPEIAAALQEVAALAIEENVELILVAGDLFDKRTPSADAEAIVNAFFVTVGRAGIPSVVIAGNHDSPKRLEANRDLLGLAKAHVYGNPRDSLERGALRLELSQPVCIAALPYASERQLLDSALIKSHNAAGLRGEYHAKMRLLSEIVCQDFSEATINILMMHGTMAGATLSRSRYSFADDYIMHPNMFPPSTSYVALGHIHGAQGIQGYSEGKGSEGEGHRGGYSGSLIQLDFGEQGEEKYALILEAKLGRPTEIVKRHRIAAGKGLKTVQVRYENLPQAVLRWADDPRWLKLEVSCDKPVPGLKEQLSQQLPNAIAIETTLPDTTPIADSLPPMPPSLPDAFANFYEERHQEPLSQRLRQGFEALYHATFGEEGLHLESTPTPDASLEKPPEPQQEL